MVMYNLQPVPAVLEHIQAHVPDHHLFTFSPEVPFSMAPGQFIEVSILGVGSFPVSACDVVSNGRIMCCIRRVGRVTEALYRMQAGDRIGIRGAFGNGFPLGEFQGKDALLIAGGLGMAPMRALLASLLQTDIHDRIILLYGSREPKTLLFRDELMALAERGCIELRFSVDFATSLPGSDLGAVCQLGLVSELLNDIEFRPSQTVVAVSGPPALYACVLYELADMGIPESRIFATLERRMRCGIGECCHCVAGGRYICRDGPVFSLEMLRDMPGAI